MKPETKAIHVPQRDAGDIAPPIRLTTTFEHGPANEMPYGYMYVRHGNPNSADLETRLAALEGGIDAVTFASGMGAGVAMPHTLPRGSTVVFHDTIYFDFLTVGRTFLDDWGITPKIVDFRDLDALRKACDDSVALLWFETPTNPTIDLVDIRGVVAIAAECGARTFVDGTFASPALQRPFELGVDYVMHSLTKYIGGHSDVQGGAVVVREDEDVVADLKRVRKLTGGVLAPFNAWLAARGLHTLYCRVEKHCENAQAIADALADHPGIEKLRYPFHESHPQFELAKSQMSSGGGMLSIDVAGGRDAALRVAGSLRLIANATSLGGTETLVEHRKSIEGPETTTPENLLRFSIGLEHADDLIGDIRSALDSV